MTTTFKYKNMEIRLLKTYNVQCIYRRCLRHKVRYRNIFIFIFRQNEDVADDLGFEVIRRKTLNMETLHLFARSCREKEEWFQKLSLAVSPKEKVSVRFI